MGSHQARLGGVRRSPEWHVAPEAASLARMDAHLVEIVNRGGHAQSAEAAHLLAALEDNPKDNDATARAHALIQAFLKDPDLMR